MGCPLGVNIDWKRYRIRAIPKKVVQQLSMNHWKIQLTYIQKFREKYQIQYAKTNYFCGSYDKSEYFEQSKYNKKYSYIIKKTVRFVPMSVNTYYEAL